MPYTNQHPYPSVAQQMVDVLSNQEQQELLQLRQEVLQLRQLVTDLEIELLTATEHGDFIEGQLQETNLQLQVEVAERQRAETQLQSLLETVSRHNADLEIMLQVATEHGDTVEFDLYNQALQAMQQSEEQFREIAAACPVAMVLCDRHTQTVKYANATAGVLLGKPPEQLLNYPLTLFYADPRDYAVLFRYLQEQGYASNYELQIKRFDGAFSWVTATLHPLLLRRQSHNQEMLLATFYDISERKRVETALLDSQILLQQQAQELEGRVAQRTYDLQQAEIRYRSIFENATEGIFQATIEGQFLTVNPALAQIYGYDSSQDLMNQVTQIGRQLYVEPHRRDELLAFVQFYGSISGCESQVYRKDGQIIWISESIRQVRDREGHLLYYEGLVQDITERRQMEDELRQQRIETERVLLSILPQTIAERLKRSPQAIADHFEAVSILFADIVDFTGLAAQYPPTTIVELLNQIFTAFDDLCTRYGLEKIKTIGDAYMVVGGLPQPRADHQEAIANLALEMLATIQRFKRPDQSSLNLRIGINSGSVVAGVIGKKKFIYDLWGDAVNLASRMETSGDAGKIQVSESFYQALKNCFDFEERGTILVKGKGEITTYWLKGRLAW